MKTEPLPTKWVYYNGILIPDAPPHMEVKLSKLQAKCLLKQHRVLLLRWVSNFDCGYETNWWYVIKNNWNDEGNGINKKARHSLKRALSNCHVQRVDAQYIAKNGYSIYKNVFDRYDTVEKPISEEAYRKHIHMFVTNPAYEFWGAFHKVSGNFIGYLQCIVREDCCEYSSLKLNPEYLKFNPGYALIYQVNNHYLNERNLKFISSGARNIYHKTNTQQFLVEKFGFRKAYCRLNIAYRPIVKLIINIVYPFRQMISRININPIDKLNALLLQENIRRSFGRNVWGDIDESSACKARHNTERT